MAGIRKSLKINLSGSVIIFDEAHNIESICAETASLGASPFPLCFCILN
jgi:regulator of telomere elongation helicase 1